MENKAESFDTVDKFMMEYLRDETAIEDLPNGEELIVDFDIEYPEGVNYTCINSEQENDDKTKKNDGKIEVVSTLGNINGKRIIGLEVKLYKVSDVCTMEIEEKVIDCNGIAKFCDLENGTYRVVQLIDSKYFNKPKYINWNEVLINDNDKSVKIYVVNTIRSCKKQR